MEHFDYNYHTHTWRCNHAFGTDEAFIKNAIKAGIKVLGFSDHIMLPKVKKNFSRGSYRQLKGYINSINKLKEKYKGQIEIHLGLEAEYLEDYLDYYKELLDSKKVEYLILGQHCRVINHEVEYYFTYKDQDIATLTYTEDLIKGIQTGLFKYVCHPDFCAWSFNNNSPTFEKCMRRIIEEAIKYDLPIEINLGGRRKKLNEDQIYCSERLIKIIAEYKDAKVIVGYDAHNPKDFFNSDDIWAKEMIKKYNLNEIKRLTF